MALGKKRFLIPDVGHLRLQDVLCLLRFVYANQTVNHWLLSCSCLFILSGSATCDVAMIILFSFVFLIGACVAYFNNDNNNNNNIKSNIFKYNKFE